MNQLGIIILTSITSGALSAAIVSGLFSNYRQKNNYKNEYYKYVIQKRIEAYEYISSFISIYKGAVFDKEENRCYHIIFSQGYDYFIEKIQNLQMAIALSVWIENDTLDILTDFSRLFVNITPKRNLVEFGKDHYKEIGEIRDQLENLYKRDILSLHNIKQFKRKKAETRFVNIDNDNRFRY